MKYVNKNWRVILTDDFKQKLKSEIKQQKIKIKEISKLTGVSMNMIWKFHEGKYNVTMDYLLKVCGLLQIGQNEFYNNTKGIYTKCKKASFNIQSLIVDEEFVAWWGLWIGEGDHSSTHEAVSFTNYEVNLLKLHISMLKKFNFPVEKITAEIITNKNEDKELIRRRWSRILILPRSQITSVNYMENATQEGSRVQVWSAGLFRVLHKIDYEVKQIIMNSSREIKIAYLKGIFAAEGSVRKNEVRIAMKDRREMCFIRKLILNLGIDTTLLKVNVYTLAYELSILGRENLEKFQSIGGFGLHKKRNKRLEFVLDNYGKTSDKIHLRRLKQILDDRNLTNHEISKELNLQYANVYRLTSRFIREGKLVVDKSEKEFKYYLN